MGFVALRSKSYWSFFDGKEIGWQEDTDISASEKACSRFCMCARTER